VWKNDNVPQWKNRVAFDLTGTGGGALLAGHRIILIWQHFRKRTKPKAEAESSEKNTTPGEGGVYHL